MGRLSMKLTLTIYGYSAEKFAAAAACTLNPKYVADAREAAWIFKGFSGAWSNPALLLSGHPLDRAIYREELDGNIIEIVIMAMRA